MSTLPRILGASGVLPRELHAFGWSDVVRTWIDPPLGSGRLPYLDVGFAYPPVVAYVSGLLAWRIDDVVTFVWGWSLLLCVVAGLCGYMLSRASGPGDAIRYWALTPQLLLLAGMNFDVLATTFLVAGVLFARADRPGRAGLALGVAIATKLFPAAAAGALVVWLSRRRVASFPVFAASCAAVTAALYLPTLVAPYSSAPYVAQYAVGVAANHDSVWGLVALLLHAAGAPADRIVVVGSLVGMALTFLLVVLPRARRCADPAAAAALGTLCVLLWTRLYSPQYSLWVLPFFALCALPWRTFALLSAADIGVFFTVYPISVREPGAPAEPVLMGILGAAIVVRHIALIRMWRDVLARIA